MRFLLSLCLLLSVAFAAEPSTPAAPSVDETLHAALQHFRAEGAKGWSFTQTTDGEGHRRVERYDAAQPEFSRWTLLEVDGRAPSADELQDYHEKLSRRSRGGTAPKLTEQLDLATATRVTESADRVTYEARLKPGEAGDSTAQHLFATLVVHTPTRTIESFEIATRAPFSPVLGVKIAAMRTTMRYSLPTDDRPSLLLKSETHLRGRAFLVKSLDADLTVTFSDHAPVQSPHASK